MTIVDIHQLKKDPAALQQARENVWTALRNADKLTLSERARLGELYHKIVDLQLKNTK